MSVAQSYDRLMDYIKNNKAENLNVVRTDKNKQSESLSDYAFHKRKKFDIETPEQIPNRNYIATRTDVPQFVYRNYTINYFANKYRQEILPKIFNNKSQKELRHIVHYRDASHLMLEPNKKILDTDNVLIPTKKRKLNGSDGI